MEDVNVPALLARADVSILVAERRGHLLGFGNNTLI